MEVEDQVQLTNTAKIPVQNLNKMMNYFKCKKLKLLACFAFMFEFMDGK